jgi:hypothetical protein
LVGKLSYFSNLPVIWATRNFCDTCLLEPISLKAVEDLKNPRPAPPDTSAIGKAEAIEKYHLQGL